MKLSALLENKKMIELTRLEAFDEDVMLELVKHQHALVTFNGKLLDKILINIMELAIEKEVEDDAEVETIYGGMSYIAYSFEAKQLYLEYEGKVDYTLTYVHGEDEETSELLTTNVDGQVVLTLASNTAATSEEARKIHWNDDSTWEHLHDDSIDLTKLCKTIYRDSMAYFAS